jgi:nucleoside-diphosphate-sugar epimerase
MEAAIEAGVKTFVYSSSLLVYANVAEAVDVDTPAKPLLDYGRIKLETEKRLNEAAASASITFSALRLPHVYGSRSLGFRMLKEGRLILPGSGKCTYSHLHVTDAARSLISCAEQGYTKISPIGDNQQASWHEFISLIRSYYPDAKVLVLPQWLAMAGTAVLLPFRKYRANPGMETPGAVRSYNCNIAVKPGLVWKDLGLNPNYPTIYDGIPAVVKDLENLNEKAS